MSQGGSTTVVDVESEVIGEGAWVAMYMPASDEEGDPSRAFPSEEAAWEYVLSRQCPTCKRERELALGAEPEDTELDRSLLSGLDVEFLSEETACLAEWEVVSREEWDSLGAAGEGGAVVVAS